MHFSLFSNVAFVTFLVSFLPLFELKGAIPFAMSTQVWGDSALSFSDAFLIAFCGSSLVVPIVAIFFKKITTYFSQFKFLGAILSFLTADVQKRGEKFQDKQPCTERVSEKSRKSERRFCFWRKNSENSCFQEKNMKNKDSVLLKKSLRRKTISKMLAVFFFVAFPVPLTGVWTGTALAVIFDLKFFEVCIATILGNLVCGLLVCFVCAVFPSATTIFLTVFLVLVFLALTIRILKHFLKNRRKN